jgi:hypothetical protein
MASRRLRRHSSLLWPCPLAPGTSRQVAQNPPSSGSPRCTTAVNRLIAKLYGPNPRRENNFLPAYTGRTEYPGAKSVPVKVALAGRLPRETTLAIREIAERLHLGSWKGLNNEIYRAAKASEKGPR